MFLVPDITVMCGLIVPYGSAVALVPTLKVPVIFCAPLQAMPPFAIIRPWLVVDPWEISRLNLRWLC